MQPGASHTAVAGVHGDVLKIRLSARPVEGAANAELVRFLAGVFGVAKRDVTIEAGETSRRKRVAVQGAHDPRRLIDETSPGVPPNVYLASILRKVSLYAILPSRNTKTSMPRETTVVPSLLVPRKVHSLNPRSPSAK